MTGALSQLGGVLARRGGQLQRAHVVVREHLGPVLDTIGRQLFEPTSDREVLLRPVQPGNLSVRDIPDQRVGEGELHLVGD